MRVFKWLLISFLVLLSSSCNKEESYYFEGDWEVENPSIIVEEGQAYHGPYDASITRVPGQISIRDGCIHHYLVHTYLKKIDSERYEEMDIFYDDAWLYKFSFDDPHILMSGCNYYDLVSYSTDQMVWRELETGKELVLNRKY
jgi:hypothetical protein